MTYPKKLTFLTASLVIALVLPSAFSQTAQDYIDYSTENLPGRLYIPPTSANDSSMNPLILALHGGGAIGNDNSNQLGDFAELLAEAKRRKAFLYAPQATTAFWHVSQRPEKIMAMIDRVIEERNADPNRIYITGFSMGGGGTWDLINLFPGKFAAAIPIAGINPRTGFNSNKNSTIPTWAFHARNDSIVSFTNSRTVINGILHSANRPEITYPNASDNTTSFAYADSELPLQYTEWPTGDHFIWWRVYATPETYNWLFNQNLGGSKKTLNIINIKYEPPASAISFDIETSSPFSVSIESSKDLLQWSPYQQLANTNGTIHFETMELDRFFRAIAAPH